jgi:prepilin-type N-terminal cleavage/methylation domain-containing protein
LRRTKPLGAAARPRGEGGFTLVELLVVILIIAVLAEIAIPAFLGQASKADDAAAKSAVRTAATAMEGYRLDHGDYCGAQVSDLVSFEASLGQTNGLTINSCTGGDKTAYSVSVTSRSSSATVYTVSTAGGLSLRSCSTPGQGGCPQGGTW